MRDWIKHALTRTIQPKGKREAITVPPDPRLVYGVKFTVATTIALTALEITHILILHKWNSEIFAAITGLIGTITGILTAQRTYLDPNIGA
jgi:hypothetical protein